MLRNPFQYGRELEASELVDRDEELRLVRQTIEQRSTLFLIGPRRFGKTSILRAATEEARAANAVVLRYDAEAYPTLDLLVRQIVADAISELSGNMEKAGDWIRRFFGRLRPSVDFSVLEQTWSVSLGVEESPAQATLLAHALDGLESLAEEAERPLAVIIDEFQHIIEREGIEAERQIRAAIQTHRHIGYIFAGSKTRFLADMTGDPSRPFYRLGERRFIGPIPREDFRAFLRRGFADAGLEAEERGIEAILDFAEDVPYNVQRLASACWNALRDRPGSTLTAEFVAEVLERTVRQDDPFYTQTWNSLNAAQQKALLAVLSNGGRGLYSRDALANANLALGTMQHSIAALERNGILRAEEDAGTNRYVFEDPSFAAWIRLILPGSIRKP